MSSTRAKRFDPIKVQRRLPLVALRTVLRPRRVLHRRNKIAPTFYSQPTLLVSRGSNPQLTAVPPSTMTYGANIDVNARGCQEKNGKDMNLYTKD